MSKEKYILKNQVHFGALKTSVPKGTKIELDKNNNKVYFNGVEHDNISEIELCIKAGYIIPYVEGETEIDSTIKISKKAQDNKKTYDIDKSDLDSMNKEIDISNPKKEEVPVKDKTMKVIKEDDSSESRGLKVISNNYIKDNLDTDKKIMQVVNGDDGEVVAKIAKKETKPKGVPENNTLITSNESDTINAINGEQGTVVKSIGKKENTKTVASGKKLTAKHASKSSEDKAKANAEARKKASEARRAKKSK